MNRLLACAVVLLVTASGCFWPFSGHGKHVSLQAVNDGVSVEVLNPSFFQKERKVYFEPFSAGTDAEAGDALDRLALMIIKGFSDAVEGHGHFVLLSGDNADGADLVIRARVEEFKVRGFFRKKGSMKVRADVCSVSQDEVLALVYAQGKFKGRLKDSDQAAYQIGYSVAEKLSGAF